MMRRLIAIAMATGLAGCMPAMSDPPSASRAAAPDAWRTPIAGEAELERDWWTSLGDPQLSALVEQARANNPDIAIALARVEQARAQERIARGFLLPSLTGSLQGSEARSVNAFGNAQNSFGAQGIFQASYELDLFGKNRAQLDAARANVGAREADREGALLSVSAATASGYVTLLSLDDRLRILRDTLTTRQEAVRIARDRYGAGYSSQLELRQAEAEYEATRQQIPALETAIAQQENALSNLVGNQPQAIARGGSFADLRIPPLPGSLPSELMRRRPDIARAEYTLAASTAQMQSARAQFMPRFDLVADAGGIYSSLLDDVIGIWSVGGSILAPIFEGGRLRGQFDAATAARDEAAFAYRKAVLGAFREVEDVRAVLANLDEQERALEAQSAALASALQHATRRYEAGYSPYIEKVDAQRALLSTQIALNQLRNSRLTTTIALYQTLGGGYRMGGDTAD